MGQNRHMLINPYQPELLHIILIDLIDTDSRVALMAQTQEGKKA